MDIAIKVMQQAQQAETRYEDGKAKFVAAIQDGCPTYAVERYASMVSSAQYLHELWSRFNSRAQLEDESGDIREWLPKAIEDVTDEVMRGTSDGSSTCAFSNAVARCKQEARVEVRRVLLRMQARVEA